MRRSVKGTFPFIYFVFLCLLMIACIVSVIYVNSLLKDYEASQPEKRVEEAIALLIKDAKSGDIWNNISFPNLSTGKFEKDVDLKKQYSNLISDDNLTYSSKSGGNENELKYGILSNGFELAELTLEKDGEAVTKLAVFTIQNWKIKSVRPIIESHTYTLSVPSDFSVSVNGIKLTEADGTKSGESGIDYKISDIYMKPDVVISDNHGNLAKYTLKGTRIIPELYNYSLTLPSTLSVELNGEVHNGEVLADGRVRHDIRLLTKPSVKISDNFGNKINYNGGNDLPLTYMTVMANSDYSVKVAGSDVPPSSVTEERNREYEAYYKLEELGDESLKVKLDAIPLNRVYNIAILKDDAEIEIKNADGSLVAFDKKLKVVDLTKFNVYDVVLESISSEIDILDVAGKYSLLTSNDLKMNEIQNHLIVGSYQYEEAKKYAGGIDISFTSPHTLKDPIFTKQVVSNCTVITDDCFSVDVYLVKPMDLLSGGVYWKTVDDLFNERLYFIRYDDPNNNNDTDTWKLVGMRALGDHADE